MATAQKTRRPARTNKAKAAKPEAEKVEETANDNAQQGADSFLRIVPTKDIEAPWDDNPRGTGRPSPKEYGELKASIEGVGLLNPVTVIATEDEDKPYRLVAGFRRFAAVSSITGMNEIPARVIEGDALMLGLAENSTGARVSVNPMVEAERVADLIDRVSDDMDIEQVANCLGYSLDKVERMLLFTDAPDIIKMLVRERDWSFLACEMLRHEDESTGDLVWDEVELIQEVVDYIRIENGKKTPPSSPQVAAARNAVLRAAQDEEEDEEDGEDAGSDKDVADDAEIAVVPSKGEVTALMEHLGALMLESGEEVEYDFTEGLLADLSDEEVEPASCFHFQTGILFGLLFAKLGEAHNPTDGDIKRRDKIFRAFKRVRQYILYAVYTDSNDEVKADVLENVLNDEEIAVLEDEMYRLASSTRIALPKAVEQMQGKYDEVVTAARGRIEAEHEAKAKEEEAKTANKKKVKAIVKGRNSKAKGRAAKSPAPK